jgi:LacI family transcriptional regulator
MRAAGLPRPKTPPAAGAFTIAGGAQAAGELLAAGESPEAIVCGNDQMAIGVLDVLAAMRVRVPDDLAVTGFDDVALARRVRPPLTTVAQPMRDIGGEAVRTVLARIADPAAQRRAAVLPIDLVVRRSCGCRAARPTARRTSA